MTDSERLLLECALFRWRERQIIRHKLDFVQQMNIRIRHRLYHETP